MASNQTFNIKIGRNQLFELVSQLSAKDKNDLIKELQAKSYLDRFNELLSQLKTDEVSIDEIIAEVDVVRNKRFESGKPDLQYS